MIDILYALFVKSDKLTINLIPFSITPFPPRYATSSPFSKEGRPALVNPRHFVTPVRSEEEISKKEC